MSKLPKIILLIIIIMFLSLYFSKYQVNYYENKQILTEEAIKRYENDLKEGKTISKNNYIEKEKNYSNKASIIGIKASKLIEKIFTKSLKMIIKYIDQ